MVFQGSLTFIVHIERVHTVHMPNVRLIANEQIASLYLSAYITFSLSLSLSGVTTEPSVQSSLALMFFLTHVLERTNTLRFSMSVCHTVSILTRYTFYGYVRSLEIDGIACAMLCQLSYGN